MIAKFNKWMKTEVSDFIVSLILKRGRMKKKKLFDLKLKTKTLSNIHSVVKSAEKRSEWEKTDVINPINTRKITEKIIWI